MNKTIEEVLQDKRERVEKIFDRHLRHMWKTGQDSYTERALRCQVYLDELGTAEEILQNKCNVSQVTQGLINCLHNNGMNELEDIFLGEFVTICKVKMTGVYFLALAPMKKV